jgi:Initiator Replication protein
MARKSLIDQLEDEIDSIAAESNKKERLRNNSKSGASPAVQMKFDFQYDNALVSRVEGGDHLIKHTAAIHIENSITLIDRKISNILMKNAFGKILTEEKHVIKLVDIQKLLGWETLNDYEIKGSLDRLVGTKIKWNIFQKDAKNNSEWVVSTMLASANYKKHKGYCEYSYSYHLRQLLGRPNLYAKIDLLIQKNFKSKHALAIWEFVVEAICSSKNDGNVQYVTGWIDIEDLRKMLALEAGSYKAFKDLNRSVLKSSIEEINKVSDLTISVESKREYGKVVSVRFFAKKTNAIEDRVKKGYSKIESVKDDDISDFDNLMNSKNEEEDGILKVLVDEYCISDSKAKELIEKKGIKQVLNNITYIEKQRGKGTIKNISAFALKAIENNYLDKVSLSSQLITRKWDIERKIAALQVKIDKVENYFKNDVMKKVASNMAAEETNNFEGMTSKEATDAKIAKYHWFFSSDSIDEYFDELLKNKEIYNSFHETKQEIVDLKLELYETQSELEKLERMKKGMV